MTTHNLAPWLDAERFNEAEQRRGQADYNCFMALRDLTDACPQLEDLLKKNHQEDIMEQIEKALKERDTANDDVMFSMVHHQVAKVCRALFPGSTPVLCAYNRQDDLLFALPCKPKDAAKWLRQGTTSADKKRVAKSAEEDSEGRNEPIPVGYWVLLCLANNELTNYGKDGDTKVPFKLIEDAEDQALYLHEERGDDDRIYLARLYANGQLYYEEFNEESAKHVRSKSDTKEPVSN